MHLIRKGQSNEVQNLRRSERRFGSFHRAFPLPPNAVVDGTRAEFEERLLTVVIPKTEQAKPTEIPINVNS